MRKQKPSSFLQKEQPKQTYDNTKESWYAFAGLLASFLLVLLLVLLFFKIQFRTTEKNLYALNKKCRTKIKKYEGEALTFSSLKQKLLKEQAALAREKQTKERLFKRLRSIVKQGKDKEESESTQKKLEKLIQEYLAKQSVQVRAHKARSNKGKSSKP